VLPSMLLSVFIYVCNCRDLSGFLVNFNSSERDDLPNGKLNTNSSASYHQLIAGCFCRRKDNEHQLVSCSNGYV
jgi:hypothetical protein